MESAINQPRTRAATVLGLIVALGWPFGIWLIRAALHEPFHKTITDTRATAQTLAVEWTVALAVILIALFWERLPLRTLGFRRPARQDFLAMIAVLVGLFVALGILGALSHAPRNEISGATPAQILAIPLGLRVFTFLTAGFCEELFFRAYAIERLTMLTGNLWAGSIAAVVLFTLGHIPRYGFGGELLGVLVIAVALTALYAWRRNFWICAAMHAAIDAFGLLVAPALSVHAGR